MRPRRTLSADVRLAPASLRAAHRAPDGGRWKCRVSLVFPATRPRAQATLKPGVRNRRGHIDAGHRPSHWVQEESPPLHGRDGRWVS